MLEDFDDKHGRPLDVMCAHESDGYEVAHNATCRLCHIRITSS